MKVRIRLFASLAERAGFREREVEVEGPATVRSVLETLKKGPLLGLPPGTRVLARTAGGATRRIEAGNQGSYFGSCAPAAHVGLGSDALVELDLFPPGHAPVTQRFEPPLTQGALRYVPDRPESPLRILPAAANMPAPHRPPR